MYFLKLCILVALLLVVLVILDFLAPIIINFIIRTWKRAF